MSKKYKCFLLSFGCIFCLILALFLSIFLLPRPSEAVNAAQAWAYKEYLLEKKSSQNRIIIESGSNSLHAINSQILEKELNKPVINIAENFQFPLLYKIYRLEKFLNEGDIVVMPLEYIYFFSDLITGVNYEWLGRHADFYFKALPLYEKLKVIANTDTKGFASHFKSFSKYIYYLFGKHEYYDISKGTEKLNEYGDANYTLLLKKNYPIGKEVSGTKCFDYVFASNMKGSKLEITTTFRKNLLLIKEVAKKTKSTFIFTYPAITGDECYNDEVKSAINEAVRLIKENGFIFIGKIEDSYFGKDMLLDTYYHLNDTARDIRTKRLTNELKKVLN